MQTGRATGHADKLGIEMTNFSQVQTGRATGHADKPISAVTYRSTKCKPAGLPDMLINIKQALTAASKVQTGRATGHADKLSVCKRVVKTIFFSYFSNGSSNNY